MNWNNSFFFFNTLNIDSFNSFLFNDFIFFFLFFCTDYSNTYFYYTYNTLFSFLDFLFLSPNILYFFYFDLLFSLEFFFNKINFILNWTHESSIKFFYFEFPEFGFLLVDFFIQLDFLHLTFNNNYSVFSFSLIQTSLVNFIFFILLIFLIFNTNNFFSNMNFFFIRFFFLINNLASENRFQLDWSIFFLNFILFLWIPLLIFFDDIWIEVVDLYHQFIILFFIFLIFYLIYRYSIHYFSFLEATLSDQYSTNYLSKQMVRDFSNSFALFLRFFLLIFRLNIYDGLDDFLDSYYIFFIDFDEDSYIDESFWYSFGNLFSLDNREDLIFYKLLEVTTLFDLFLYIFIIFGKLFFYWTLILEEIFRLVLAFYISYLIIFEVHAVNVSYFENTSVLVKNK